MRAKVDTFYTYANSNTWWQFKTVGTTPPGTFSKSAPANNSTNLLPNQPLSWGVSSDTTSYEYCIDSSNDNTCTAPAVWQDIGRVNSIVPSKTTYNASYYWQVRAKNALGTTEASDGWWKYTTMTGQSLHFPLILRNAAGASPTLVNGDFEQGSNVGWTEYSSHGWDLIMNTDFPTGISPHGGSWAVWLGGGNDEVSYINQQVTIASGNSHLHLWYWIASEDVCNYDYGYVRVNSSNIYTWNLCITNNTGAWAELNLNLSAYAGQTVTLEIRSVTDSSTNSNFFIDDVSFAATAAPPEEAPAESPPGDIMPAALPKSEVIKKR